MPLLQRAQSCQYIAKRVTGYPNDRGLGEAHCGYRIRSQDSVRNLRHRWPERRLARDVWRREFGDLRQPRSSARRSGRRSYLLSIQWLRPIRSRASRRTVRVGASDNSLIFKRFEQERSIALADAKAANPISSQKRQAQVARSLIARDATHFRPSTPTSLLMWVHLGTGLRNLHFKPSYFLCPHKHLRSTRPRTPRPVHRIPKKSATPESQSNEARKEDTLIPPPSRSGNPPPPARCRSRQRGRRPGRRRTARRREGPAKDTNQGG